MAGLLLLVGSLGHRPALGEGNVAVRGFEDLVVWQRAMELVGECYAIAASVPGTERYRLVDQLCRAVVSIPANIAEGHARDHLGEYMHHLSIAAGSLAEVRTLLAIGSRLGYFTPTQLARPMSLSTEVSRMLHALRTALRRRRDALRRRPPLTPES